MSRTDGEIGVLNLEKQWDRDDSTLNKNLSFNEMKSELRHRPCHHCVASGAVHTLECHNKTLGIF